MCVERNSRRREQVTTHLNTHHREFGLINVLRIYCYRHVGLQGTECTSPRRAGSSRSRRETDSVVLRSRNRPVAFCVSVEFGRRVWLSAVSSTLLYKVERARTIRSAWCTRSDA
ncbi:hypothetical protein EVAR_21832_1 [Eumeta japonica]|uniref:Uncharacterized protein n=1 Tax=Eumeta variegata TaxID=151549 RepID=A0A4C1V7C7_EUMVA|nr:hypothetical protein EVAR_21832_1 [Eumeta japonica]